MPSLAKEEEEEGRDIFSLLHRHCKLLSQNHEFLENVIGNKQLMSEPYHKVKPWLGKLKEKIVTISKISTEMCDPKEFEKKISSFSTEKGNISFVARDNQKCHAYLQSMVWSCLNQACHSSILDSLKIMSTSTIQHPLDKKIEEQMWGWVCACTDAVKAPVTHIHNIMENIAIQIHKTMETNSRNTPPTANGFCMAYVLASLAVPRTIRHLASMSMPAKDNHNTSLVHVLAKVEMMCNKFTNLLEVSRPKLSKHLKRELIKCYSKRALSIGHSISLEVDLVALDSFNVASDAALENQGKKSPTKGSTTNMKDVVRYEVIKVKDSDRKKIKRGLTNMNDSSGKKEKKGVPNGEVKSDDNKGVATSSYKAAIAIAPNVALAVALESKGFMIAKSKEACESRYLNKKEQLM